MAARYACYIYLVFLFFFFFLAFLILYVITLIAVIKYFEIKNTLTCYLNLYPQACPALSCHFFLPCDLNAVTFYKSLFSQRQSS